MSKVRQKCPLSGQTPERKLLCSLHAYFPWGKNDKTLKFNTLEKKKLKVFTAAERRK